MEKQEIKLTHLEIASILDAIQHLQPIGEDRPYWIERTESGDINVYDSERQIDTITYKTSENGTK